VKITDCYFVVSTKTWDSAVLPSQNLRMAPVSLRKVGASSRPALSKSSGQTTKLMMRSGFAFFWSSRIVDAGIGFLDRLAQHFARWQAIIDKGQRRQVC
jgi:hypothetical protein